MTVNGIKGQKDSGSEHDVFSISIKRIHGKKIGSVRLRVGGAVKQQQHKNAEANGVNDKTAAALSSLSAGLISPKHSRFDGETMSNYPGHDQEETDTIVCKHCKKFVIKRTSKDHIAGCLKSKQEKARKKKEAREAAQRAKERAERGGDDDDDDDDDAKGKKRKADGDDDKDSKKKKKKEEPKAKTAKPKGPVDVERQCGVTLPNGAQCARSLTCKSHSMGAKRAVPGRSLPYDMLLQAYQKKNQARQQKAAIDANAPALMDEDLDPTLAGPVDSDEERDSVMTAISQSLSRPQPLVSHTLYPMRRKYQLVRMKEMLSNALSGNRSGGLFSVPADSARTAYPSSNMADFPAQPNHPASASNNAGSGTSMRAPPRKQSVEAT